MKLRWTPVVVAMFATSLQAPLHAGAPVTASRIAWQVASTDAEVDRAFALARREDKPVFLYWGAVWCPPCNQVKATLFSRPDFVERSRSFVPVYVDGDKPGAQKVAARFKVSGYPTMILFKPDGAEITRLPGEVDPQRYLLALSAGLDAQAPVKELVRRALARERLEAEQWRLLAFYSWDTDEQVVFKSEELPARLSELAAAAPADLAAVKDRLALKAIAARAETPEKVSEQARSADRAFVEKWLARVDAKEQPDLLVFYAEPVVKYLGATPDSRAQLAGLWESALQRVLAAGVLSRSDAIDAFDARVDLWKFAAKSEQLAPDRQQLVLAEMNRLIGQTTDRYERQAVVPSAAHLLTSAGLIAESDAMLKAELPRAVAPYYHMLLLGSNAEKRGDAATALRWYEQALKRSEGSATRIQWGAGYVGHVVELAPNDVRRVAQAASAVVAGLVPEDETFFGRNERSLQKMAKRLAAWHGADAARGRAVRQVRDQMAKTCAKLPAGKAGRANCEAVFAGFGG